MMQNIEIDWDDTHTILCCTFLQNWSLKDFYAAYDQTETLITQSPNKVIGIVVDDSHNTSPPQGALPAFNHIFKNGTLPMAIIGGHKVSKLLIDVVSQMSLNKRLIFQVSSYEEARTLLLKAASSSKDS